MCQGLRATILVLSDEHSITGPCTTFTIWSTLY